MKVGMSMTAATRVSRTLRTTAPPMERVAFAALTLLAFSFAFERVRPLVNVADVLVLTNVEILLLLALVLWGLGCAMARRGPRVPRELTGPTALWLAVLLTAALVAPSHRTEAFRFWMRVLTGVLIGCAAYDLAYSVARWRTLLRGLALSGFAVGVLGVAEAAGVPRVTSWLTGFKYGLVRVGDVVRISSTLGYPTITAMALELTLPLVLAWVLTTGRLWIRGLLSTGLLAGLTTLVLTLSRAGVLTLLVALGLMGALAARQRRWMVVIGSVATTGALLALIGIVIARNPVVMLRLRTETERRWYQAAYQAPAHLTARPGEVLRVPLRLKNTGVRTWQASGARPFALSYHLARADGTPVTYDGLRSSLPSDVSPGTTVELEAQLMAPPEPGEYLIEWDMLQETVTWFSWKGAVPARTRLTVIGEPVAGGALPSSAPPMDVRLRVPSPGRLALWRTGWRMARARPLLGVGPDNFRLVYGVYAGVAEWDQGIHANNLYIEWLADTGIVGLLAFLWFSWRLVQAVRHRLHLASDLAGQDTWVWQLALTASLSTWFVHGLVDYFYEFTPTYVAFWLVVGLAVAERYSTDSS